MIEREPSAPFTHVVSLGRRCRTTHRLRQHFGFSTAFPFDWWITPLKGGMQFLRDWSLDRLYDPIRLREARRWGRVPFIVHADYGIRFQHEFPMDQASNVLPGWRAAIPDARARTAHLMEKFDKLNRPDRNVLFVRELSPDEQGQARRFCDELKAHVTARVPLARSTFLLISPSGVQAGGWVPLKVNDPLEKPWTGTAEIWDSALSSLGFRFERPPGWGQARDRDAAAQAGSSPSN